MGWARQRLLEQGPTSTGALHGRPPTCTHAQPPALTPGHPWGLSELNSQEMSQHWLQLQGASPGPFRGDSARSHTSCRNPGKPAHLAQHVQGGCTCRLPRELTAGLPWCPRSDFPPRPLSSNRTGAYLLGPASETPDFGSRLTRVHMGHLTGRGVRVQRGKTAAPATAHAQASWEGPRG